MRAEQLEGRENYAAIECERPGFAVGPINAEFLIGILCGLPEMSPALDSAKTNSVRRIGGGYNGGDVQIFAVSLNRAYILSTPILESISIKPHAIICYSHSRRLRRRTVSTNVLSELTIVFEPAKFA